MLRLIEVKVAELGEDVDDDVQALTFEDFECPQPLGRFPFVSMYHNQLDHKQAERLAPTLLYDWAPRRPPPE